MAVCDFDMHFTYASIGQPGSMHDTSVVFHAIENDKATFPHPPKGKYYLVDAGYPNRDGYLAPYKGERYHVPDFQRGAPPTTPVEKFDRVHSSKRNTIERTFGVWKMKWQILLKMPNYSISTQKMIIAATMTLHNYVRLHDKEDLHFLRCERDPDYVPTIPERYKYVIPPNASDVSTPAESGPNMDLFRHELVTAIALSW
uniref:DDE Tnp4 domain-containing protein n=1 Tax=Triticum urartu TaxID=4572 RepID=A0A8R7QFW2_TRIUA